MNDREKIICAIERAKRQSEEYAQDRIFVPFKEADMLISLLKEQEPVRPQTVLHTGNREEPTIQALICGNCHKIMGGIVFNYCPWCGRKVLWK